MDDWGSQVELTTDRKLLIIVSSSFFCTLLYMFTYIYSFNNYPFFTTKYSPKERADWCSRTASQFHSAVIIVAVAATLPFYEWSWTLQTVQNLYWVHASLCFSLGYFIYDLSLVVLTLMDQWPLYVVHHCAASTPLVAVLFMGCDRYSFLIAAFFLVEVTTVSMNASFFFEAIGMENRKRHGACIHFSFWAWIIFRLVMPIGLFALMFDRMILGRSTWRDAGAALKKMSRKDATCAATCSTASILIILYCNLVFVKALAPAYIRRLRTRYAKIKESMKGLKEKTKVNVNKAKEKVKSAIGNRSKAKKNA